jgi:hypothetical protein
MQTLVQFHQTQIYKNKINKKNQTLDFDLDHETSIKLTNCSLKSGNIDQIRL